jgi:two-component system alkaline phosphatase synthesis response regulator PhoP
MKILLVEDDAALAVLFRMFLGRKGDFEITHAFTGEEALQRVGAIRPDIVLLDIMLSGIDGIEVCRRLCERTDLNGIKVAMVTALDDVGKRRESLAAGAIEYWVKPISPKELGDWLMTLGTAGSLAA